MGKDKSRYNHRIERGFMSNVFLRYLKIKRPNRGLYYICSENNQQNRVNYWPDSVEKSNFCQVHKRSQAPDSAA